PRAIEELHPCPLAPARPTTVGVEERFEARADARLEDGRPDGAGRAATGHKDPCRERKARDEDDSTMSHDPEIARPRRHLHDCARLSKAVSCRRVAPSRALPR